MSTSLTLKSLDGLHVSSLVRTAIAGLADRHIRINPRRPLGLALIAAQLGHMPTPVPWLPHILALP